MSGSSCEQNLTGDDIESFLEEIAIDSARGDIAEKPGASVIDIQPEDIPVAKAAEFLVSTEYLKVDGRFTVDY